MRYVVEKYSKCVTLFLFGTKIYCSMWLFPARKPCFTPIKIDKFSTVFRGTFYRTL